MLTITSFDPEKHASMRGVERTLNVLKALNSQNGINVSTLSDITQISRPALYRVLEALTQLGYVRKRADADGYELTMLVRSLSDGYKEEDWVRHAAIPVIEELQREVVWPTDLATFHDNAMSLRETTRRVSPLTIDGITVGLRLPMLTSATGKAYLAHCGEAECNAILTNLRASHHSSDYLAKDDRFMAKLLDSTRRLGYGERQEDFAPKTGAIAVPIFHNERVLACLSLTFISSALTPKEAAKRYLNSIKAAAKKIEKSACRVLATN